MRHFLLSTAVVLALALMTGACGSEGFASDGGRSDASHDGSVAAHDASADGRSADDGGTLPMDAAASDLGASDAGAPDASATSDGGASAPCGSVVCGDGMRCCSEVCSLCAPIGALCPAIACYDAGAAPDAGDDAALGVPACRAMEAHGTGTCDHLLGYAFDGSACRALRGCSCVGPDCGGIYTSLANCTAATAPCATLLP